MVVHSSIGAITFRYTRNCESGTFSQALGFLLTAAAHPRIVPCSKSE
jgi:hypothetical protein